MGIRLAALAAIAVACLWNTGCASMPSQPESPGMRQTHDQEHADLEKELSLYSD